MHGWRARCVGASARWSLGRRSGTRSRVRPTRPETSFGPTTGRFTVHAWRACVEMSTPIARMLLLGTTMMATVLCMSDDLCFPRSHHSWRTENKAERRPLPPDTTSYKQALRQRKQRAYFPQMQSETNRRSKKQSSSVTRRQAVVGLVRRWRLRRGAGGAGCVVLSRSGGLRAKLPAFFQQ